MSAEAAVTQAAPAARTPGAKRAGAGEYVFDMHNVNQIMGGPAYSPVYGGCVEGDRMIVALMRCPAGKIGDWHSHPNEQWIYVLEGRSVLRLDGQDLLIGPGEAAYIPANMLHQGGASPEGDVVFFTCKDAAHGLHGIKHQG